MPNSVFHIFVAVGGSLRNDSIRMAGRLSTRGNATDSAENRSTDASPDVCIESIYDAGLNPERWGALLTRLCETYAASFGALGASPTGEGAIPWRFFGTPCTHVSAEAGCPLCNTPVGTVVRLETGCPQVVTSALGVRLSRSPSVGVLCVGRNQTSSAFSDSDRASLQILAPHLSRAMHITGLQKAQVIAFDALDRLSIPLVIATATAHVHFVNSAARILFADHGPLSLTKARLDAPTPADGKELRASIARVAECHAGAGLSNEVVTIGDPRSLSLHALLITRLTADAGKVLILAERPKPTLEATASWLASQFGLTPAEIRVALLAAQGFGVGRVAVQLGLSDATVRTHLHHVFEKTDTARQAELAYRICEHPSFWVCGPKT